MTKHTSKIVIGKIILSIIFIFLLASCSNKKKEIFIRDTSNALKKHPVLNSKSIEFDEIFETVCEIHLENKKDFFMGYRFSLAIGNNETFALADYMMSGSIYIFNNNGKLVNSFGKKGKGPNEFLFPCSMTFDKLNCLYIYDVDLLRISKYGINYNFINSYNIDKRFNLFAVDHENNYFLFSTIIPNIKSGDNSTIYKYSNDGILLEHFCRQSENYNPQGASQGGGMIIDSSNLLYHISPYDYRINVFNTDGSLVTSSTEIPSYYRSLNGKRNVDNRSIRSLESWFGSWTCITNFLLIENNFLLVFTSDRIDKKETQRIDIFDVNAKLIKSGIIFPHRQAPCFYTHGDYLYYLYVFVDEERIDSEDDYKNPKIIKYKIR